MPPPNPARPASRRMPRDQRVAAILQEARAVLRERGSEQFPTGELAERCGVSEGTIYKYFPTKRDLLIQVAESMFEEFLDEGVTAWFTDRVLEEQNQAEHKDLYRDNAACAARLVAATSPTMVAEAYFDQKVGPLAEAVAKKLRIPLGDVHGLAAKGELCDKLPRS